MQVTYLTHASQLTYMEPHVMAIGFFDGVHLGHQALFKHAKKHAKRKGIKCSALTFSPHPDEVIKGDSNRKYITPLNEKVKKISQCGIDHVFVMEFDQAFASLPPTTFIEKYIHGMNVKHVVVGFDFTFGFKAHGDTKLLEDESVKGDFGLTVVPKKTYLHTKISSTEIRKLVLEGNVDLVSHYLGTNYQMKGTLIDHMYHIENTFKVEVNERYILPEPGTYAVKVLMDQEVYDGELTIQTSLENDLYIYDLKNSNMSELTIEFLNRLRVKNAVLV